MKHPSALFALAPPARALLAVIRRQPDQRFPLDVVTELDAGERAELLEGLRRHGLAGLADRVLRDAGWRSPRTSPFP